MNNSQDFAMGICVGGAFLESGKNGIPADGLLWMVTRCLLQILKGIVEIPWFVDFIDF